MGGTFCVISGEDLRGVFDKICLGIEEAEKVRDVNVVAISLFFDQEFQVWRAFIFEEVF